jgi:6-pyruvoyltetrahydropterin/6-carboxytetrahydropterin synthase
MSRVVRLEREVAFSAGHRYWIEGLDAEANRRVFGRWASPHNHGHNYVLRAAVEGPLDPATGMVVNIKDVDDVLQERVVARMDQRSLNDEVPGIQGPPTLENLLGYLAQELREMPAGCALVRLRLYETPLLWGEWTEGTVTITRSYEFAASHRLHVPGMDDAGNQALFGKCCRPSGHGHNYVVEVTVEGEPDPQTGMSVALDALDEAVEREVLERYDHTNLNTDVPELAGKNPTSEVVAAAIFERLQGAVPGRLVAVKLWETARSSFEVRA